jgi:hypothetical protein
MGKIIVSENVSLDGVVQDPLGDEGFEHGGWFVQTTARDREEWAKIQLGEALATAWHVTCGRARRTSGSGDISRLSTGPLAPPAGDCRCPEPAWSA